MSDDMERESFLDELRMKAQPLQLATATEIEDAGIEIVYEPEEPQEPVEASG